MTEVVHQMISGTQQETEGLLHEHRTPLELATTVTTLKRELLNSQIKRAEIRQTNEELSKQLRLCQDDRSLVIEPGHEINTKIFGALLHRFRYNVCNHVERYYRLELH